MRSIPICLALAMGLFSLSAMASPQETRLDLRIHLDFTTQHRSTPPPAVVWLKPLEPDAQLSFPPHKPWTLVQKNRTFIPHLLVVPVGSQVLFPNDDPFYHNVFSLFDGKRFDLGLYEAGSTRTVTFSREGISYIFCNIHPEMSAVVVTLSTPLYASPDSSGTILIRNVPEGDYELHAWIEGVPQTTLDHLVHRIHASPAKTDLGILRIPDLIPGRPAPHLNKFGQPYDRDRKDVY